METIIEKPQKHNGRTIAGVIILLIGSVLLIDQLNLFFIPSWLYSWPMWIIGYGLYMGSKYHFRKPVWFWLVIIGSAFLLTENIHDTDRFVWPVAIIGTGVWMVIRKSGGHDYSFQKTV